MNESVDSIADHRLKFASDPLLVKGIDGGRVVPSSTGVTDDSSVDAEDGFLFKPTLGVGEPWAGKVYPHRYTGVVKRPGE